MTRRLIREGTICPDCDNGYTAGGECETCGGTGWIGREWAHVRDGLFYLPGSDRWVNGEAVLVVHRSRDDTLDAEYVIEMAGGDALLISNFNFPEDFAAVTAWLEGRP